MTPVPVLDAAKRILNQTQVPASLMGGESAIFNLADIHAVATEVIRRASPPVSAPQVGQPVAWRWRQRYPDDLAFDAKIVAEGNWAHTSNHPSTWKDSGKHHYEHEPLFTAAQVEARLSELHGVLADLAEADDAIAAWTKGSRPVEELTDLEDRLGEAIRACTKAYRASLQP
jgi:hypothetical protein